MKSSSSVGPTLLVLLAVLVLHGLVTLAVARLSRLGSPVSEPASQVVVTLQPAGPSQSSPRSDAQAQPSLAAPKKSGSQPVSASRLPRSTPSEQAPSEQAPFDPSPFDPSPSDPSPLNEAPSDPVSPEQAPQEQAFGEGPSMQETAPTGEAPPEEKPAAPAADVASRSDAPAIPASQPLPALEAGRSLRQFRVFYGDYSGGQSVARLRLALEVSADAYVLRSTGEAEGLMALFYSGALIQESRGALAPEGLAPQQYIEIRGNRRQRTVRFDHQHRQLLPSNAAPVALPEGTQDRLSVLYQLGLLVQGRAEQFLPGSVVNLPVAGFSEVRLERFQVIGEEILMVGIRTYRSLHLKRPSPQGGRDPSVEVWLGYDAAFQPVRIRLEDAQGQVLDQVIDEP